MRSLEEEFSFIKKKKNTRIPHAHFSLSYIPVYTQIHEQLILIFHMNT